MIQSIGFYSVAAMEGLINNINRWLKDHPGITIISVQYSTTLRYDSRMEYSALVFYKE